MITIAQLVINTFMVSEQAINKATAKKLMHTILHVLKSTKTASTTITAHWVSENSSYGMVDIVLPISLCIYGTRVHWVIAWISNMASAEMCRRKRNIENVWQFIRNCGCKNIRTRGSNEKTNPRSSYTEKECLVCITMNVASGSRRKKIRTE